MSPERLPAVTSILTATPPFLSSAAPFGAATGLACRECGATYDLGPGNACELCFGPLEVAYDEALLASVSRESIQAGPQTMWRYAGLLPVSPVVDLQVGISRLHRADYLASVLR